MEIIVFLSIVIAVVAVLTSIVLIRRVKKQIAEMTDALVDVKNGNGNRRILSATNELTAPLAYEINEIVVSYESRLSIVRQTEETNRQLMTSLSHDVRTPLTTLIGYLDAAHKGLVTGKDRDDYIETARRKAHDLKEYIDVLFDWFKLNSDEFALEIQPVEAAELTRNILIDWIPIFEDKQVDYDIDIPEQPVRVRLDMDSYMRIINNLIQNVIAHSHAGKIKIALSKQENHMELLLADKSAFNYYKDLSEKGYYNRIISGNINQMIEIDSLRCDFDKYPYSVRTFARQIILRESSVTERSLVTRCRLLDAVRSDNNPQGFIIEGFEVTENKDLQTLKR